MTRLSRVAVACSGFWERQRPGWLTDRVLARMRWAAISTWAALLIAQCVLVAYD